MREGEVRGAGMEQISISLCCTYIYIYAWMKPYLSLPPVTHGCIIASIRLYVNDMELPG